MSVWYNDNDPHAVNWLRNLIEAGHLPEGIVDERSIEDIAAADIAGYRQVHLFAGIGGWPYALDLAGWGRDVPVWTVSCPCQPVSRAGNRRGNADERHLWPVVFELVDQLRPPVIFGEQTESPDGREWLAGVRADLEELGYACGAADLCAAGAGAPHIRQRLFFVACRLAEPEGFDWRGLAAASRHGPELGGDSGTGGLAGTEGERWSIPQSEDDGEVNASPDSDAVGGLADPNGGLRRGLAERPGRSPGTDGVGSPKPRRRGVSGGVEHSDRERRDEQTLHPRQRGSRESPSDELRVVGGLADPGRVGDEPARLDVGTATGRAGGEVRQQRVRADSGDGRGVGGMGDPDRERRQGRQAGAGGLSEPAEVPSPRSPWDRFDIAWCRDLEGPRPRRIERRPQWLADGISDILDADGRPTGVGDEQRSLEPEDVVRFLSQALSLGGWRAELEAVGVLRLLEPLGDAAGWWSAASDQQRWRVAETLAPLAGWQTMFPLEADQQNRAAKLRGYGNAIVPQVAAEFIEASIEAIVETVGGSL